MTTLANKITILRILTIPAFALFLSTGHKTIALTVFIMIMATDFLDGYIARKYNQVTKIGKFLDPLADKLVVIAALVILVEQQTIPGWMAILIISREVAVTGLRLIISAEEKTVIAADKLGKIKTVSQTIAIIVAIYGSTYTWTIMLIAVILSIISGINYFWNAKATLSRLSA